MATSIDELDIEISAQTTKATKSIDSLITKLNSLSSSLRSVNGSSLTGLANGIQKLGTSMQSMNAVKTKDFSNLARNIGKLSSINSAGLNTTASRLLQFSRAMSGISLDAGKITQLQNTANAISKLGASGATQAVANLPKLSQNLRDFVNSINSVGSVTFDAKSLSDVISSLSRIGGKSATQAVQNLPNLARELKGFVSEINGLQSVSFDVSGMGELISSISRLGGKAASQAVGNIPNLAKELKNLMTTLSNAPTVSKSVIAMTNALARLARTGASSGKAADSLSKSFLSAGNFSDFFRKKLSSLSIGMNGLHKVSLKASGGIKSFSGMLRGLLPIAGLAGAFQALKSSMDISSDLTEVENVVTTTFGKYSKLVEEMTSTSITDFGMSELTAKQVSSRFQAMGTAMGFTQGKMADMSIELTKLTADMASFYNVEQDAVAVSLQSIFTGETEPLRKYGLDLTAATLEEWAHKQGIDAKMKSMSQAEKTLLRYQYVMANTSSAQGDFARTADTWANQVRILRQNLEQLAAVIGGALINALKPLVKALNVAMGYIISFAKVISDALGKIFGWTYEEGGGVTNDLDDMAGGMEDVADATDDATDAQKKFNKQLAKFDELNNYTTSETKGKDSGGGTGLDALGSGASGGEWKQQDSILKQFESDIESLYELGEYIGTALTEAMNRIDWDSIYAKASGFGTGLASFLNGLISPELFSALGTTIANSLNTALHFLDSFGDEFDWEDFGNSIAAGINSFFENFDFGLLADTLNTWAHGLLDAAITAVTGIDWSAIAQKIADLISGIDAEGIGWRLGKLAKSLANAFYQLVSNKDTWKNLGGKIADGINGFLKGMNEVDKKTGLNGWQALGKAISDTIIGLGTTIITALDNIDWQTVGQAIADFIKNIDFEQIVFNVIKLVNSLASAVYQLVSDKETWKLLGSKIAEGVNGFFKSLTDKNEKTGLTIGQTIGKTISSTLSGLLTSITSFFSKTDWEEVGNGIVNFVTDIFTSIDWVDIVTQVPKVITSIAKGIFELLKGALKEDKKKIEDYLPKFIDGLKEFFINIGAKIGEKASEFSKKVKDFIKDLPENFINIALTIGTKLMDLNQNITDFLSKLPAKFFEFALKIGSKTPDIAKAIGDFIAGLPDKAFKFGLKILSKSSDVSKDIKNFLENLPAKAFYFALKIGSRSKDVNEAITNFIKDLPKNSVGLVMTIATTAKNFNEKIRSFITKAFTYGGITVKLQAQLVTSGIKSAIRTIITWINSYVIGALNKISISVPDWVPKLGGKKFGINIPKIAMPSFATGGFPEPYSVFAAGEGGVPEILGTVGGKTAVAGGAEITGISDAIYSTHSEEMQLMREQNQLLRSLLAKETGISASDLFNTVRREDRDFRNRTGRSAFSY